MRVLVMGAGGYIGIPLCATLKSAGLEVVAVDRWYFGKELFERACPDTPTLTQDIRDVNPVCLQGMDAVVDLAGLSNDATSEIDPRLTRSINFEGAVGLAALARDSGIQRYVYSSSAAVYGSSANTNLSEDSPANPLTEYSKSKRGMEEWLLSRATDSFQPVILRNATAFGVAPRMRLDLAINGMAVNAWRRGLIYVMGGGSQWRPFVHVQDVCNTILWALQAPKDAIVGQIFNVGSNENNWRIGKLAQQVALQTKDNVAIHNIPDEPDKRSYHLAFNKLHSAPGFSVFSRFKTVQQGIDEVLRAIQAGTFDPLDPRTITLSWYKSILEWEERLNSIRLDGRVL